MSKDTNNDKKKDKEKIECGLCGGIYLRCNKSRHLKTKIHTSVEAQNKILENHGKIEEIEKIKKLEKLEKLENENGVQEATNLKKRKEKETMINEFKKMKKKCDVMIDKINDF